MVQPVAAAGAAPAVAAPRLNWEEANCQPMLEILKNELPRFGQLRSLSWPVHILDSSAFSNTALATLKNMPYCIGAESASGITARLRYLEAGMMAAASFVHNVVMAVICTVLAAVTLGQIDAVNDYFKREWVHSGLSLGSMVVGLVGTVAPTGGAALNGVLIGGAGLLAFASLENVGAEAVALIKDIFQRNRESLRDASRALVGNDERLFQATLQPALRTITDNIEDVEDMWEMSGLIAGAVGAAMRNAFGGEAGNGIAGGIGDAVRGAVGQVAERVVGQVAEQVAGQVAEQVAGQVGEQVAGAAAQLGNNGNGNLLGALLGAAANNPIAGADAQLGNNGNGNLFGALLGAAAAGDPNA